MFTGQWLDKPNTKLLKIKSVIHIGLITIIFLLGPQNTFFSEQTLRRGVRHDEGGEGIEIHLTFAD